MSRRTVPGGWITLANGERRYRLPYRDPDTGRQTSGRFVTKGDAATFYDKIVEASRSSVWVAPDAGRERFVTFAQDWADAQDWARNTRNGFRAHLRRIELLLGTNARLDQIDTLRLQRLRSELTDAYAVSTATMTLGYACTVMRAAHATRRIPADPTVGVKPPTRRGDDADGGRVGPDNVPTRDEVVAIIAATPARFRAAVVLGACGLRVGEVMGVTADRLDLDNRGLIIDRQLEHHSGRYAYKRPKTERARTIEMPTWATMELRRHLRDHGPFWSIPDDVGPVLFRGSRGSPLSRSTFYVQVWRPALIGAGLDPFRYRFHSLRHWCASALLASGAPLSAVAGHLGDTPETVMRVYTHWLRDDHALPARLLDAMLAPGAPDAVAQ
jgi:integrase